MKLISWNVNGIRAVLKKNFTEFFDAVDADVFCVQETKARAEQVNRSFADGYHAYWCSAVRPGYSGVATFSKVAPLSVRYGMGIDEHDQEGRALTLEYADCYVVNVYVPNAQNELRRLPYRMQWDEIFLKYLQMLEESKPVVVGGDFNVAHREIDLARPKANRRSAGFSDEERAGFQAFVDAGFVDTFRVFCDEPEQYSWWSYRGGARGRNVGWRIDYFLASSGLQPRLAAAGIRQDVMGSDHCPVELTLSPE